MPVNYAKEYLIFVQTGVVFLPFHVRVKNGRQQVFRFYIDEITQVFFCLLYTSNKGEITVRL